MLSQGDMQNRLKNMQQYMERRLILDCHVLRILHKLRLVHVENQLAAFTIVLVEPDSANTVMQPTNHLPKDSTDQNREDNVNQTLFSFNKTKHF